MDQTKTTGTESPDDGNELESSASTAPEGSDDRNAESGGDKETDWKALAISLQEKAKRVNELEAKLKEKESAEPSPPVTDDAELQEEDRFDYFVQKNDPVAKRVRALERTLLLKEQLDEVPREERKEVVEHFRKNAYRLGDINAARAEIREKKLERELEETRKRLELLEKPPDPDVMKAPPTHGREIGARETRNKQITEDQFDREAAAILASQGPLAEMKYRMENAGRIKQ